MKNLEKLVCITRIPDVDPPPPPPPAPEPGTGSGGTDIDPRS